MSALDIPVMELRKVYKSYHLGDHQVHALQGVDFIVKRGEFLAITGPSGSGKSTILNLCGLIDQVDRGELLLHGQSIQNFSQAQLTQQRRDTIGFIFQSFNLIPVMTVAENVDYPLFLSGMNQDERRHRVQAELKAVGLQGHADHLPDALSGGQRQRVAIARALIKRPSLVIADEPTASLDSSTAAQVIDMLRERCRSEETAFIIATHDERLTRRSDRMLALLDGKLQ